MASDPKKAIVDGRRRAITIHDGARLTPSLVRVLEVLADEANALREQNHDKPRGDASSYDLEASDPVLVARTDGIAVYVPRDGRLL